MSRAVVAAIGLIVALIASITAAVTFGAADISVADVWGSIWSHATGSASPLSPVRDGIVWQLRLPRVLTAAAVGAGLALVGAVMQAVTRNQLADPYLLGLSGGASFGAASVLLLGAAVLLPVAAFAGAMVALIATLTLASAFGPLTPTRTVLAGVAVSSFATALTSFAIFWNASGDSYREILGWLLGSLAAARWPDALLALVAVAVIGIPLMLSGRTLDAFAFGDRSAAALGVPVAGVRWILLGASALLTGALVAVSGAIGFIGLVLPHAVRLLTGPGNRALLPLSALAGAVFLVWADTIARTAFEPRELPVGIITALIGAPVFAALLMRRRSQA
ncbi:putative F420-0 ABC transporter permease subunit [Salinibacterium sp. ZJ77]|uniref:putative F420-0 ABC transporter permease subunit n=1 Tax=Salinibacterium sp. ZJ77 TaxID=2708337 RepID=UPI001421F286|nr:putative F420-0 ABC transporter permease subunit [Salinibacterium sp. ZJ77]